MPNFIVECEGIARELYAIEADSEEEAMKNWASGACILTEVTSAEPISVRRDD
jgi:hypothetical protein